MSKGSRIVPVRIPEKLMEELCKCMEAANRSRFEEPYTISSYVRACLIDKLKHLARGKKKRVGKGGEV